MKKIILFLIPALFFMCCKRDNGTVVIPPVKKSDAAVLPASLSTLSFSGYTWNVRDLATGTQGPGPNHWSGANAYVDANGYLHLKITKAVGKWYCAEVTSTKSFGYGTYEWYVEGRIDSLDKNVVLGLFNYSGVDGFDEMDIEYARWGIPTANNTNFTIYPAQGSGLPNWHKTYNTTLTGGDYTTQRFKRNGNSSVFFQELAGFQTGNTNQIVSATCNNPPHAISKLSMPVHMNLWLFQGHAPANKSQVELIIHNFKFTPK